jgi:hypothetical protein
LAAELRRADPPVIGYIKKEWVYLDVKAVTAEDIRRLPLTIARVVKKLS